MATLKKRLQNIGKRVGGKANRAQAGGTGTGIPGAGGDQTQVPPPWNRTPRRPGLGTSGLPAPEKLYTLPPLKEGSIYRGGTPRRGTPSTKALPKMIKGGLKAVVKGAMKGATMGGAAKKGLKSLMPKYPKGARFGR